MKMVMARRDLRSARNALHSEVTEETEVEIVVVVEIEVVVVETEAEIAGVEVEIADLDGMIADREDNSNKKASFLEAFLFEVCSLQSAVGNLFDDDVERVGGGVDRISCRADLWFDQIKIDCVRATI